MKLKISKNLKKEPVQIVNVKSSDNEFLGKAFFNPKSHIAALPPCEIPYRFARRSQKFSKGLLKQL